jgi:hypothetical protein
LVVVTTSAAAGSVNVLVAVIVDNASLFMTSPPMFDDKQ